MVVQVSILDDHGHNSLIAERAPYPYYHAATDTPDKLAYPELTQVTLGLFAASAELARKGIG